MNSESSPARRAAAARSIIHRAPSRGSFTTCRLVRETPTFMGCLLSSAISAAAAGAAGDPARLHQLEPRVVRTLQERDATAVRELDRPFEQPGTEAGQACDVGLHVDGIEAEVLEAVVRHRVALPQALVGARAGNVHVDAAVGALAADEAVAEHAGLVAGDLEVERAHVPLGGLARIGRLEMDVVDPVAHGILPLG